MVSYRTTGLDLPAANAAVADVSVSDYSCDFSTTKVHVGSTGDLKVDMVGTGTGVVIADVQAGAVLDIQITKIYNSGTTASSITVFW